MHRIDIQYIQIQTIAFIYQRKSYHFIKKNLHQNLCKKNQSVIRRTLICRNEVMDFFNRLPSLSKHCFKGSRKRLFYTSKLQGNVMRRSSFACKSTSNGDIQFENGRLFETNYRYD